MPWIARDRRGRKVAPEQASIDGEYTCPECDSQLVVVRKGSDGTARHFRHPAETIDGDHGATGGCSGVAESDLHLKWKSLAASQLAHVFADRAYLTAMEHPMPAPESDHSHRWADAAVVFNQPDPVLGRGIVAEVQHKHDAKDVATATEDFIASGFAVVWLEKADFGRTRCHLTETGFRNRAEDAVWPAHIPPSAEWESAGFDDWRSKFYEAKARWERQWQTGGWTSGSDAIAPPELADRLARRIWQNRPWRDRFSPGNAEKYITEVATAGEPSQLPPITLPPGCLAEVTRRLFRTTAWTELFETTAAQPADTHIATVRESLATRRVPVILPEPVTSRLVLEAMEPPDPPPNPYEDMQCRQCGAYWHVSKQRTECAKCGTRVDVRWNWETGRVSKESLREHEYGTLAQR